MDNKYLNLQNQVLLGTFLGIFCGLFFGEHTIYLHSLGQSFLMLVKMTVLPYLSVALIHGVGSLSLSYFRSLFGRGLLLLVAFWGIILSTIYFVSFSFPSSFNEGTLSEPFPQTVFNMQSFLKPLSVLTYDVIPIVVLFSLLLGIVFTQIQRKDRLLDTLANVISALKNIAFWISRLSPLGGFALVATTAGTLSVHDLETTWVYILAYIFTSLILSFVVFPCVVAALTPVRYRHFLKEMRFPLLLSFCVGNVLITLPFVVELLEKIASQYQKSCKDVKGRLETLLPVFYNLPNAGNLLLFLFVLFLAAFYSPNLSFFHHLEFISSGIFSLLGSGVTSLRPLPALMDQLQLPRDAMGLYLETIPLNRHFQALATTAGLTALTLVALFSSNYQMRVSLKKTFFGFLASFTVLFGGVFLVKQLSTLQPVYKGAFFSLSLENPVEYQVRKEVSRDVLEVEETLETEGLLARVKSRGILRVGYSDLPPPFSYYNQKDQLVGYDVAFAHQLARQLGCRLEFIPFHYGALSDCLNRGVFDLAMSGIVVTEARLHSLVFTEPYMEVERAFVVEENRQEEFASIEEIQKVENLKIAVLSGSSFEEVAKTSFPHAQIVRLHSYEDFLKEGVADVLLWTKEEGSIWSALHPRFKVVKPYPSLGKDYLAYALAPNSEDLLLYINDWLDLKKLDGFFDEQYQHWILGDFSNREPRWSIIRNVLHWDKRS